MLTSYVMTDDSGYIIAWSDVALPEYKKVQTDESLLYAMDFCKVDDGVVVADENRKKEIIDNNTAVLSPLEQTKKDLSEVSFQFMQEQAKRQDLEVQVADMAFQIMQMQDGGGDAK